MVFFAKNYPLSPNFIKLAKRLVVLVLFLLAIGINIYFRLFPVYFPQLKQQATLSVQTATLENITKAVEKRYPDFNQLVKNKIIIEIFENENKNTNNFKEEIDKEYKQLKSKYQDENGQTYLLEVDGYQWMRYVKNILENGHPGDSIRGGRPYDDYMMAPTGRKVVNNQFFFYLSAFLYRLTTIFLKNLSLTSFLFFLPLFYAVLFITLLYFIVRSYFSDIVAFLSAIFVGLNPLILGHTNCGWFDYDSLILFMALMVVWLLSFSFRTEYRFGKRLIYSLLSAFAIATYSSFWIGYWWIFSVCAAYYLYCIVNAYSLKKITCKQEIINYTILIFMFFATSFVLCSLVLKTNAFENIFIVLQNALPLGSSQQASIWPYTYYTVNELSKPSTERIVGDLGGPFIFTVILLGALWVYIKEKRSEKKDFIILMILWMLVAFVSVLKSSRFIAFLAVPFGIFFGAFVSYAFRYVKTLFRNQKRLFYLALIGLIIFVAWSARSLFYTASVQERYLFPWMDTAWHRALIYIEKNTDKNSIINSWWDYGNFFKTVSKRKVIFDPQSQHLSLSYWMANVILATDENRAINILRMVNNSSSTLFDEMQEEINDNFRCIVLLNKILKSNETEAKFILEKENISSKLKNRIIKTIFIDKLNPAYFVVDKSMLHKMASISFLGNWDFSKVYIMRHKNLPEEKLKDNLKEIFSISGKDAKEIYEEMILVTSQDEVNEALSKRDSFRLVVDNNIGKKEGNLIYFDNGIILNLFDHSAMVFDKKFKRFENVLIYDGERVASYESKNADQKGCLLFIKDNNEWRVLGLSKELAQSLFVKLYFLQGLGLKYFEPFYADKDAGMYIFKIKWSDN